MAAEREGTVDSLRARLDRIEKRVTDLFDRVEATGGEVKGRMKPFLDETERSCGAVRKSLHTVTESAGAHGRELADRVRAEIEGLEHEVAAAREALTEELAKSRAAFKEAARSELDAWRARLDHLRVQADLGRMDARDDVETLRERAERAYSEARSRIDQISERGEENLEVIRSGAERVMDEVRRTVRELRDREKPAA